MASNDSFVRTVVRGTKEVRRAVEVIDRKTTAGTLAGVLAVQRQMKKNVRSRLRGRPRWDRRGASQRTGPEVNLNLSPHHVVKSGGPGRLTGKLSSGVGSVKHPKPIPGGGFKGGTGVGGKVTSLYKKIVEADYPYFEPAAKKTEKEAEVIWAKAWAKALK